MPRGPPSLSRRYRGYFQSRSCAWCATCAKKVNGKGCLGGIVMSVGFAAGGVVPYGPSSMMCAHVWRRRVMAVGGNICCGLYVCPPRRGFRPKSSFWSSVNEVSNSCRRIVSNMLCRNSRRVSGGRRSGRCRPGEQRPPPSCMGRARWPTRTMSGKVGGGRSPWTERSTRCAVCAAVCSAVYSVVVRFVVIVRPCAFCGEPWVWIGVSNCWFNHCCRSIGYGAPPKRCSVCVKVQVSNQSGGYPYV